MEDLNSVTLVGRLTRDPEMKGSVLPLRLAFTTRQKTGEVWEDRPNYIDVVVFGRQGETLYPLLGKGSRVAVAGNLEWREWVGGDGKTQSRIQILARSVQLMDPKREGASAPAKDDTADIPF